MRHACGRAFLVLLMLTMGCTGDAGAPRTEVRSSDPDSGQQLVDELDRASQRFRAAYEKYLRLYQLGTLDAVLRETPPALDEMERAFTEWKAVLQAGEETGVRIPVDRDLLQRFITKVDAWIDNQRQQNEAFIRCGLTSASAESELLECVFANRRLVATGLQLARQVNALQAEVLGLA